MDILDESRAELREERMQAILAKVGKIAALLAIIAVIGASLYLWYDNYKYNKASKLGGEYMTASLKMQSKEVTQGLELMDALSKKQEGNYSALAALNNASYYAAKKDFPKAAQYYDAVCNNNKYDKYFRDFASLAWNNTQLNAKTIDLKQAIKNLEGYVASDFVFKNYAKEQLATLYIADNDNVKAKELLNGIITRSEITEIEKERAKQLIVLIK